MSYLGGEDAIHLPGKGEAGFVARLLALWKVT